VNPKQTIEDIYKKMELDLLYSGKSSGEGSSLIRAKQGQDYLSRTPQGGGVTPLMPISPLDLALETLSTGLTHAKGVDPRVAIAGSLLASKYGGKAAKFADVKAGSLLSRRAYKKGMKSASKDPMFSDINYSKEAKSIAQQPRVQGQYLTGVGEARRHKELFPNYPDYIQSASIELGDRKLSNLFNRSKSTLQREPLLPDLFNKNWAESIVRHESRHYKQNVEGMKRAEMNPWVGDPAPTSVKEFNKWTPKDQPKYNPSTYGYDANSPGGNFSTLINVPKPKYTKGTMFDAQGEDVTKYYRSPIEVEARIEELVFQEGKVDFKKSISYEDLRLRAGFSNKQISDMITDYKKAKKTYDAIKYIATSISN
tara:strand:- start:705 stop:1808 length:1104 start_codon:yes stop_codon:yes gene_type:complete